MLVCAECGYVTGSGATCSTCGVSLIVGSDAAGSAQGLRILGAIVLNCSVFALLGGGTFFFYPVIGNLAAAVLWFKAGKDQLCRGKKGAADFSGLMTALSLLTMAGVFLAAFVFDIYGI